MILFYSRTLSSGTTLTNATVTGEVSRYRVRVDEARTQIWDAVALWFSTHARALPWRAEGTTPWAILVSEVMSQQTPVARVEGPWREWMTRWPRPSDLAAASSAEVLLAWGSLGYPRRALRLQHSARIMDETYGDQVPADENELLSLPGIGRYTAAAVMSFAYQRRALVLDTNIRRVLARMDHGVEYPAASETAAERQQAWQWVPSDDQAAALWSAGVMELGALVCSASSPACSQCPIAAHCRWLSLGSPSWQGPPRRGQAWEGTNRQCRGRIMAELRARQVVEVADISWPKPDQLSACIASLVADGLISHNSSGALVLGGRPTDR